MMLVSLKENGRYKEGTFPRSDLDDYRSHFSNYNIRHVQNCCFIDRMCLRRMRDSDIAL
jgi:hypothetical protein